MSIMDTMLRGASSASMSPQQMYLRSSTDLPHFMAAKSYTADTTSGNGMCMQFTVGFLGGVINIEVGLGVTFRQLGPAPNGRAEIEFMGALGGSVGVAKVAMGSLSGAISGRISGVAPHGKVSVKVGKVTKEINWSTTLQSMWLFKKWAGWYVVQTGTYRAFTRMISTMKTSYQGATAEKRWAELGKSMAAEVGKEIKVVTDEIKSAGTTGAWYTTMPGMDGKAVNQAALVSGLMEKALKVAKYLHQMFVIEVQKLVHEHKGKCPKSGHSIR